ncbi:MAG: hypothetical protein IJK02_07460 [Clostridia bacterium]|nr:hypothetical protein [Clostridia bacterium]MBR0536797.1 hypothetical protein [Clostridia bacterium]
MSIRDNPYYFYESPVRPQIRKLGTIACDRVEATPVVFRDRLYRFEYYRPGESNEENEGNPSCFRFVDVGSGALTPSFAENCHLGCAFADGDTMYAVGVRGTWGGDTLSFFRSEDLAHWNTYDVRFEGLSCFNTGICEKDGVYTLLIEVSDAVPFTFRFARSQDMENWELLPDTYAFQKDRYAGGPAICTLPGDPYYYVLYLEAYPGPCYANCIARSKNLAEWEYSPINPVLMFNEREDKQIANPFLTPHERERIRRALDINNSDMELCEFNGRTVIYYSWGNQRGIEFLAEAAFEGTKKEFLTAYFERPTQNRR